MSNEASRPPRREFLGHLGLAAIAASIGPTAALAEPAPIARSLSDWDMSWVERVSSAPYRAVIDTTKIANDELYTAVDMLDTFHEVYPEPADPLRVVVVLRHFAAAMAQSDAMWEKYSIGEERSVTDPDT